MPGGRAPQVARSSIGRISSAGRPRSRKACRSRPRADRRRRPSCDREEDERIVSADLGTGREERRQVASRRQARVPPCPYEGGSSRIPPYRRPRRTSRRTSTHRVVDEPPDGAPASPRARHSAGPTPPRSAMRRRASPRRLRGRPPGSVDRMDEPEVQHRGDEPAARHRGPRPRPRDVRELPGKSPIPPIPSCAAPASRRPPRRTTARLRSTGLSNRPRGQSADRRRARSRAPRGSGSPRVRAIDHAVAEIAPAGGRPRRRGAHSRRSVEGSGPPADHEAASGYHGRRMTRILLYTGKGGVGKTSIAAATDPARCERLR